MAAKYRNEQKYLLKKTDAALIQMRLDAVMDKDKHLGDKKSYLIRSIYFDDIDDNCFYEKVDGVNDRKKWRIRIYDCESSVIHLECKRKINGLTQKISVPITIDDTKDSISGKLAFSSDHDPLLQEFSYLIHAKGFRPVTIVQYERIPYIWGPSNVRITFDLNLSSCEMFDSFFDKDLPVRPIMAADTELLEVKFDTLLPDFVKHTIGSDRLRYTAFSKYELCRRIPMSIY